MYYTTTLGSIKEARMDGSNPKNLVTGLKKPWGITIDLKTSKLLWTDQSAKTIESSNLEGGDRRTIVKIASRGLPIGIAVSGDRIYWGEDSSKELRSSTIDGRDVQTLHNASSNVLGLTLKQSFNLPRNRSNHCAGHACAKVCVLTPTASRCLP